MAVKTLKQIPNFSNGGVDMMVDFTEASKEKAHIIELTPIPQIGALVFPMEGKGRDIPSAIIDSYFPETINRKHSNPNIFFDFKRRIISA